MARKMFSFSYANPRQWVQKHEGMIIKTARGAGLAAGFTGGAIGAMITRNPLTMSPMWAGGTIGGTFAGDVLGRRLARSLEARLPTKTSFKIPRIRMPSARRVVITPFAAKYGLQKMKMPSTMQIIASPVLIPFKVGEAFGNVVVNRRKRMMAKQLSFVPARRNSFI